MHAAVPPGQYRCTLCHEVSPYDPAHFPRNSTNLSGLTSRCKRCVTQQMRKGRHDGLFSPAQRGTRRMAYDYYLGRIRSGAIDAPWTDVLLKVQDYYEANPAPRVTIIPARTVRS